MRQRRRGVKGASHNETELVTRRQLGVGWASSHNETGASGGSAKALGAPPSVHRLVLLLTCPPHLAST